MLYIQSRAKITGGGHADTLNKHISPQTVPPDTDDTLPLDEDEDWYPLYVLQASRLANAVTTHSHTLDILPREIFQDQSTTL